MLYLSFWLPRIYSWTNTILPYFDYSYSASVCTHEQHCFKFVYIGSAGYMQNICMLDNVEEN